MGKFLLLTVLVAVLALCGTNAARLYTTNQQVKAVRSMNETRLWVLQRLLGQVSPLDDESGYLRSYFAQHEVTGQAIYGFIATMDVYAFDLSPEQYTAGVVYLFDGPDSSLNVVQIGWEVSPRMYGDSRTRLGGLWSTDGYQETGCPNEGCGFQQAQGAPIALGGVIGAVSQPNGFKHSTITIKIIKDGRMGDWLVYYGLNQDDPALIGCFPRSLFTGGMADHAAGIRFGGYVETSTTNFAPMGSGYLPTDAMASASMRNIQFIDENGRASLVMENSHVIVSDLSIYGITPLSDGQFFFGGPLSP